MRKARLVGFATISLLAGSCATASEPAFPVKLIPGAFTAGRQPDGNTVIFEDTSGLIVVDTGRYKEHQERILAFAREREKPIRAIVNTHWHLDHSGGNQELRAVHGGAKLYTSNAVAGALTGFLARSLEQGRTRVTDPKLSEAEKAEIQLGIEAIENRQDLLPDVPVTGRTALPLGDRHLELHLARHAATEGDTWLFDPGSATLVAGDLVVLPLPFFDTACASGWRVALDALAAVPFETLVPGHGPTLSRDEFETYRTAFGRLVDCASGKSDRQSCIDGWRRDAAPLLRSEADRAAVQPYLAYYLDEVLRSSTKQAEFCGTSSPDEAVPIRRGTTSPSR